MMSKGGGEMKITGMAQAVKRLNLVIIKLGKNRDELRAIQDKIEEMLEGKDDDIDDLERVCDNLSRYV
jgi:uncharacterized coiled-coil DUF342 family protein